jgi:hypothetical protein
MQHLRLAVMMTLLSSTLAAGQDMRPKAEAEPDRPSLVLPTAALAGATVFDVLSTQQAFARGCAEGNTLFYGSQPSSARLLTIKATTAGAAVAVMIFAHKTGHHRLARVFAYAAGGAQAVAGTLNSANACR